MSVALNDPKWSDVDDFLGKMKPGFAIVKPDADPGDAFDIEAFPLNIVIGPDGVIKDRVTGFSGPDEFRRTFGRYVASR